MEKENIAKVIVKVSASSTVQNLEFPVEKRGSEINYWHSISENGSWYEVDFLT